MTNLKCEKCEHTWKYKGKNQFWVTCPRCRKLSKMPTIPKNENQ